MQHGAGKLILSHQSSFCTQRPCTAVAPRIEELSRTYKDAEFIKVDVDSLQVELNNRVRLYHFCV